MPERAARGVTAKPFRSSPRHVELGGRSERQMNIRTQFLVWFIAICVGCSMMMMASIFLLPRLPMMRFVPLAAFVAAFVAVYSLFRHYRRRLPPPTPDQLQRAIKANRRLAWIYLGGLVLGLLSGGRELLNAAHGFGILSALIPIGLAAYHLRTAARLSRMTAATANVTKPN